MAFLSVLGRYLFLLSFACYPIIGMVPLTLGINSTPLSIFYRLVCFFLGLTIIIYFLAIRSVKFNIGTYSLILFWIIYLIKIIYDLFIEPLQPMYETTWYYFFWAFGVCFVPMLSLVLVAKFIDLTVLNTWLYRLVLAACVLMIIKLISEHGFSISIFFERGNFATKLSEDESQNTINALLIGQFGSFLFILSSYKCFFLSLKKRVIVGNFMTAVIGFLLLVASSSRGPLLAASIVFLYVFIIALRRMNYKRAMKIILFLVAVLVLCTIYFFRDLNLTEFALIQRIGNTTDIDYVETRKWTWPDSWNDFLLNPLFGKHFLVLDRMYLQYVYPHNQFIEVLMATGILGAFFFSIFFMSVFKKSNFNAGNAKFPLSLLFIYMALSSASSGAIFTNIWIWSLMPFLLQTSNSYKEYQY